MRTDRAPTSALIVAAITTISVGASAQPTETPPELYRQGVAAYQVRDFATALSRFQRAYVLSGRPELLMNVGMTFQAAERRREAIDTFRQYLTVSPDAPNRAEVVQRIADLEAQLAAQQAPAPRVVVVATPPPVIIPPRTIAAPPVWPWITLSAGALFATAGALMLALPADPGEDRAIVSEQGYLDARSQRAALQTTGAVLGAVGLAAVVTGVVGLATRPRAPDPHSAWNLHVDLRAGGGALGLTHAF